jgi:lysophospholipase
MSAPEPFPARVVPPGVAPNYRPADCYGFIERAGGRLRHAVWNASGTPRGNVVLLGGRGEFIEKYATEVVGELLDRGYAVSSMDWRGQGLSSRSLADRDKGHIDDFATYAADFRHFLETVVAPAAPRPLLLIAHSMGAHIVLRSLAEQGTAPLAAGLLVSPMTGLGRAAILRAALALIPESPFFNERFALGSGPYAVARHVFAANQLTHDERRFHLTDQWFAAEPRLTLGGPTVGWARQALRSMGHADATGYFERIALPIVLLSGDEDIVVDIASHAAVAARLAHAVRVVLPGARHEIMMETDPIRARFWQAFDRLATEAAG